MRYVSIVLVLVVAAIVNAAPASNHRLQNTSNKPYYDINDAEALFEDFIKKYNRNYKNDTDKAIHFQAFVNTLKEINKSNAEDPGATYDINNFADYTDEQKRSLFGYTNTC